MGFKESTHHTTILRHSVLAKGGFPYPAGFTPGRSLPPFPAGLMGIPVSPFQRQSYLFPIFLRSLFYFAADTFLVNGMTYIHIFYTCMLRRRGGNMQGNDNFRSRLF
jgi:hypothetical protein